MAMSTAFQRMRVSEAKGAKLDTTLTVKDEELLTFTESCRDLYEAGVPINEILRQIQQATPNKRFAMAITLMVDDIENGKLLSEAMARFPKTFGEDYRSLIRAAEESGKWTRKRDRHGEMRDGILEMLISYIKRRSGAREKVKSGLIYPAVIVIAIIAALAVFAFYVLPSLKNFLSQINPNATSSSFLTNVMFTFADLAAKYWWAPPVAVILAGFLFWSYWRSGGGKELWMKYQLRMKVLGPIFVQVNLGEIMWLMGTLFSAGLTPQETLDIVVASTRNKELSSALDQAKEYLYQGISFSDAMKKSHWIFEGHAYMVLSTAQKSGRLSVALQNYAEQLFEQVDRNLDRVVKLIEPALITIVGVIIGLICIAFYGGLSGAIANLTR